MKTHPPLRFPFGIVLFTAIMLLFQNYATAQKAEERILFVGNSFTFYWNVPRMIEKMAEHHQLNWDIDQSTLGGATLKQHWEEERGLKTRTRLQNTNYDRVILQDHSTYPVLQPETTRAYIKKFISEKRNYTPQWYFFSTWMYPYLSEKTTATHPIATFYSALQQEIGHNVLEVGKVFDAFQKAHPEIGLLTDDNKHTSPQGSYLIACIIFSQLSGINPEGLPNRFFDEDTNANQVTYYNIVQLPTAKTIQTFVGHYLKQ